MFGNASLPQPSTIIDIAEAQSLQCEWRDRHPFVPGRWDVLFRKTT